MRGKMDIDEIFKINLECIYIKLNKIKNILYSLIVSSNQKNNNLLKVNIHNRIKLQEIIIWLVSHGMKLIVH